MKKALVIFSFFILFASTGKAQTILPAQYQELVKKLTANLPKTANLTQKESTTNSTSLIDLPKVC